MQIMANLTVVIILILIVFLAIRHIVKKKKSGAMCMGCPDCGSCSGNCNKNEEEK